MLAPAFNRRSPHIFDILEEMYMQRPARRRHDPNFEATQVKLREIFNNYAAKAVEDFPHLKGRLALIHSPSRTVLAGDNIDKTNFESEEHLQFVLQEAVRSGNAMGSFASVDPETGLATICLNRSMNPTDSDEQNMLFELDHELGHLAVKDAIYSSDKSTNFKECAADTFAVLKNVQRFGEEAQLIDRLIERRREGLLRGGVDHFTSMTLKKLKPLLAEIDFENITPQHMATLAWRMAASTELRSIREGRDGNLYAIPTGRYEFTKEELLEGIPLRPTGKFSDVSYQERKNNFHRTFG